MTVETKEEVPGPESPARGEKAGLEAGLGPGAGVLDSEREFAASILYASDEQIDALVLALGVSHNIDLFNTAPRLLAVSDEPQSGKSTLLHLVLMLALNGWKADATSFALRARFSQPGKTAFVHDEISKLFGASGLRGHSSPLYKLLVEGYERTATLSLAVDRMAVDVPAFSFAACAGLGTAAPADLRSRSIIFHMKPLPDTVAELRSALDSDTWADAAIHRERLHRWVLGASGDIRDAYRSMRPPHRKLRARLGQIWLPLFAVAQAAGGEWPERCLRAFKALGLDASDQPVLLPAQMVLRDAAKVIRSRGTPAVIPAPLLRDELRGLADVELYGQYTDRRLAMLMAEALGANRVLRGGAKLYRGWDTPPILAAWDRLAAALEAAGEPEPEADEFDTMFDVLVTEATEVTEELAVVTEPASG